MGIDLTPSLRTLSLDRGQIRASRWAFALVIISLLLQIVSLVFLFGVIGGAEEGEGDQVVQRDTLVVLLLLGELPRAAAMFLAGALHGSIGRSPRWKWSGWALAATVVGEVLANGVGLALMGESYVAKEGTPMGLRLGFGAEQVLRTLEDWWVAVLLGEFAVACRDTVLLGQSERLGYAVLAALLAVMAMVGWTVPLSPLAEDSFAEFLAVATMATGLLVLVWMVQGVFRALAVGRLLIAHLDQLATETPPPRSDDSPAS
jgi:hypothetical protein